jgi:putative transposase
MISSRRKRISEYIVDKTLIKVGSEYVWLWVAIESNNRRILALSISKERNMFVAEYFLSNMVPNGLSVSKNKASYSFLSGEKPN